MINNLNQFKKELQDAGVIANVTRSDLTQLLKKESPDPTHIKQVHKKNSVPLSTLFFKVYTSAQKY